jgi:U3 small nucleolar RNA-associated protein 25
LKERPYNTLLQLLNTGANANGPARKKRKLQHRDEERRSEEAEPSEAVDEIPDSQDELAAQAPTEDEDEGDDEDLAEDGFADGIESDPFETHFAQPVAVELDRKIKTADEKWATVKGDLPGELRVLISFPQGGEKPALPSPPKSAKALMVSLLISCASIAISPC